MLSGAGDRAVMRLMSAEASIVTGSFVRRHINVMSAS
jgi:hypothetical protein